MAVSTIPLRPRLVAETKVSDSGGVELHLPDEVLEVTPPDGVGLDDFIAVLRRLDGARTLEDLVRETGLDRGVLDEIVAPAVAWGLIDEGAAPQASAGLAVLSRLEDLLNRLLEDLVFSGPFWRALQERPESLPRNVFYGFGLENWHFLFRENEFDSAVLAHAENARVRALLNDFYQEEHRHDDIVVRAFAPLGISRDDLMRARPLPTTTALIKSLSWWARTDPLFFAAGIGVLEGRLDSESEGPDGRVVYDAFLAACAKAGLDPAFVEPLRAHARINAGHGHDLVSRELFAEVPGIDAETERRWHAKAYLFMETYAAFYNGILEYYSDPANPLLRTVEI